MESLLSIERVAGLHIIRYETLRKSGVNPLIVSDAIKQYLTNDLLSTNDKGLPKKKLGINTENLSNSLFLNDDCEYGMRHMNPQGNQVFAKVVYDQLVKQNSIKPPSESY